MFTNFKIRKYFLRHLNKNIEARTNGKVKIWSDAEGGNINIYPPDGTLIQYWQMDAYNGNFRLYSLDTNGAIHAITIPRDKNGIVATTADVSNVESKLPFQNTAQNTSGATFRYNFLEVYTKNKFSELNQTSFFWLGNNHGSWQNIPPGMDEYATGIREVFWADANNILVKVTETTKRNLGKTYYNYYTNNGETVTWSGWVQKG